MIVEEKSPKGQKNQEMSASCLAKVGKNGGQRGRLHGEGSKKMLNVGG